MPLVCSARSVGSRRWPAERLGSRYLCWRLPSPPCTRCSSTDTCTPSTIVLALLIGLGAARPARLPRAATCAVLLTAVAGVVTDQASPFRYEDLRTGADLVLDTSRPTDATVFAPATVRAAASYYLARIDTGAVRPQDVASWSGCNEQDTGNFGGRSAVGATAIKAVVARARVWRMSWDDVSSRRTVTDRAVLALLNDQYALRTRKHLGHLIVEEFVRPGS